MAEIWSLLESGWGRYPLPAASAFALTADAATPVRPLVADERPSGTPMLSTYVQDDQPVWLVTCAPSSVSAGGLPVALGIRVLDDHDDLCLGCQRLFLSLAERPDVGPLPESDAGVLCARCQQPIDPGTPAVRCPNPSCGAWHHQVQTGDEDTDLPCWTYAATCANCASATELDPNRPTWSPEDL